MTPQPARTKSFAFSYSKIKNFETCPRRYHQIDVLKNFKEDPGEALMWGNELHDALDARISKGKPLPITMQRYEHKAEGYAAAVKANTPALQVRTELKLSFDRNFQATGYFDNATWFRCKVDVLALMPDYKTALAVDWKTGKILEDHSQLALSAQAVFANYPEVDQVVSVYEWLADDATTRDTYQRDQMGAVWNTIWPRIDMLEDAHASLNFPPTPSGLCKRFCVVTSCEYHGKGSR
jgi:hypothetical protein